MADAHGIYDEIRRATEFTVTGEHLKLLRRAYVSWDYCEFGAPEIDAKRPYGNSDVIGDIAEILDPDGLAAVYGDDDALDRYRDEMDERFSRIHAETALVLSIALFTGKFEAGRYVREKYSPAWRPAQEG